MVEKSGDNIKFGCNIKKFGNKGFSEVELLLTSKASSANIIFRLVQ